MRLFWAELTRLLSRRFTGIALVIAMVLSTEAVSEMVLQRL